MERMLSSKTPEEHSLGPLITILEMEFPNEDTDNVDTLRMLLKREFGVEFSEIEILNHYVSSLEEEDMKLQYKHLNIMI